MNASRDELLQKLRSKKWTLSLAESCTGGKIAGSLVEVAGVSDLFLGSIVSYSYESKKQLLEVSSVILEKFGAVSEEVVAAMAQGAIKKFSSDVAVAVSGIAGPGGGTPTKPVGTVCFAFAGPGFLKTVTQKFSGDRLSVQEQSVNFAFEFLKKEIDKQ